VIRSAGYQRTVEKTWLAPDGAEVTDFGTLARLKSLAIPPAWVDVWVAPDAGERVQATGVDSRGRTQYRYSGEAVAFAANQKFEHTLAFAGSLPLLHAQLERDLRTSVDGAPELAGVSAAAVRLIERGFFRVGNERYARDNHTYGLTTIRRDQLTIDGDSMTSDFIGKEHLAHRIVVTDEDVARLLRALLREDAAPDDPLFLYGPAARHRLDSAGVNAYIHAHTGTPATAKVFRTWGATVVAATVAAGASFSADDATAHRSNRGPYLAAAALLGDTVTVARQSYVHPRAVEVGSSQHVRRAVARAAARAGTDEVRAIFHQPEVQLSVHDALASSSGRKDG
jgi:DNA topoisomerase I